MVTTTLSVMEGVYSRTGQLEKKGVFRKCKRVSSRVREENEYRSKKVEKVRFGRRKEL